MPDFIMPALPSPAHRPCATYRYAYSPVFSCETSLLLLPFYTTSCCYVFGVVTVGLVWSVRCSGDSDGKHFAVYLFTLCRWWCSVLLFISVVHYATQSVVFYHLFYTDGIGDGTEPATTTSHHHLGGQWWLPCACCTVGVDYTM